MTDVYEGWQQPQEPVIRHAKIGARFRCDPFVTIGTEPFSFLPGVPRVRRPVTGGVVIGSDVEIMSHTNIDRGTERDTAIGDGTKIDRLVHVAHDAVIGKNCLIVAGTVIGGFAELGDGVYVGMNSSILPRVKIGAGARIGAGAVVLHDVPANEVWAGVPAKYLSTKGAT